MTRLQRMNLTKGRKRWFWRCRRTGFLRPIYLPIVNETACITVDDRCRLLRERLSAIKFTRTHVYTNPHDDGHWCRRVVGPIGMGKSQFSSFAWALSLEQRYGNNMTADVNKEFTDAAAR